MVRDLFSHDLSRQEFISLLKNSVLPQVKILLLKATAQIQTRQRRIYEVIPCYPQRLLDVSFYTKAVGFVDKLY